MKLTDTYLGKLGVYLERIQTGQYEALLKQKRGYIDTLLEKVNQEHIIGSSLEEVSNICSEIEHFLGPDSLERKVKRAAKKQEKKKPRNSVYDAIANYRKSHSLKKKVSLDELAKKVGSKPNVVAAVVLRADNLSYDRETQTVYFGDYKGKNTRKTTKKRFKIRTGKPITDAITNFILNHPKKKKATVQEIAEEAGTKQVNLIAIHAKHYGTYNRKTQEVTFKKKK